MNTLLAFCRKIQNLSKSFIKHLKISFNFLQRPVLVPSSWLAALLDVRLDVEVEEEREEHGAVEEDDVAVLLREVAVDKEREGCVDEERGKLHQLHRGQVPKDNHHCIHK